VPASPTSGARRPVTALFADVVGSTALAESMDPEDWAELMADVTTRMGRVVERYGGRVGQVLGDGILAFFGAPVAHEDDPQRAVRAALDLVRDIQVFGRTRPLPDGGTLRIRVGVNTGPVVVRDAVAADGRRDATALGDAVNVAARLQAEARPDTVLVTADTYTFVRDAVDARSVGGLTLKGKQEPVEAFEIAAWTGTGARPRGVPGLTSPLVGRDAELARLMEAVAAVREGRGRAAVVLGEPGIGKSRLVAELRRVATTPPRPLRWLEARCLSYGQNLPHHLAVSVVRAILELSEDGSDPPSIARQRMEGLLGADAGRVRPFVGDLLSIDLDAGDRVQVDRLGSKALQNAYVDALQAMVRACVAKGAVVLALDDVHWADEASVDILVQVLPLVRELPILLALVARPDRDVPGWRLVAEARVQLDESVTEVRLDGLGTDDARRLVGNLLVIESLPDTVRDYILQRSDGNPFFVEEVIRMLIDRGAIRRMGENWVASEAVRNVEIPDTIHGLLLARIDRLPEDARQTLRVASVIGRRFGADVLGDVLAQR
jgi:class 3 adenylate cyclase